MCNQLELAEWNTKWGYTVGSGPTQEHSALPPEQQEIFPKKLLSHTYFTKDGFYPHVWHTCLQAQAVISG